MLKDCRISSKDGLNHFTVPFDQQDVPLVEQRNVALLLNHDVVASDLMFSITSSRRLLQKLAQ